MEDRQVQHIFESNATSAALAPNVACHKCLARESNPRHLCSNQGILPLDYRDGQNSSWGTGLMSCSLRICHHHASYNHYLSFCGSLGHGPESVSFVGKALPLQPDFGCRMSTFVNFFFVCLLIVLLISPLIHVIILF